MADRTVRRTWLWWSVGWIAAMVLAAIAAAVLPAPRQPIRIYTVVDIARPPQAVFDYVTTPGNWPKWHPSSLAVSGATDHPLRMGEQVTEDYIVAGRRGRTVWQVVARDAPRHWKIQSQGESGGQAWITYTLTDLGGKTRFEREMLYRMPNLLAALLDPLVTRRKIADESSVALRQLKQVLEKR
jgi:uncharacterized protein YndB with AHSA1/START domain